MRAPFVVSYVGWVVWALAFLLLPLPMPLLVFPPLVERALGGWER